MTYIELTGKGSGDHNRMYPYRAIETAIEDAHLAPCPASYHPAWHDRYHRPPQQRNII